jgi:hypothetical protein
MNPRFRPPLLTPTPMPRRKPKRHAGSVVVLCGLVALVVASILVLTCGGKL